MKKHIIKLAVFAVALAYTLPASATVLPMYATTAEVIMAVAHRPKPGKALIKWIKRFYKAYEVYDAVTRSNITCEAAYYRGLRAYQDYERLYRLACQYWGSDYGYRYYNEALAAYRVADYYNGLLYNNCQ